ncbi:amiloride-sensitive sodium channel subunit gamma [Elysia marginata]|uniref:Amiloride-sensitive sodium channel subunit gamma n=1 Tax=Elysia marginata TaxID=1093978 RepID=A0AAV4GG29_9GAST|nr:amiloride-sensitive sodium channel subunit gamma [Elysia marginata]
MSSQHVYYTGEDNYYDHSGLPYADSGYERPYDHQYPGPFRPHPAYGVNRPSSHWPGNHQYPRLDEVRPKRDSSRKKGSKRENPKQDNDQDPRERFDRSKENGSRPKQDKSDWDSDSTSSPDDKEKSSRPSGVGHIIDKHTDKFSMSGVSYIKGTKNPVVKFVWSILLIAALAAMGYHLYRLVSTYREYKKQTSVELSFSSLQFPAVTFCNVNPVRMSQLNLATPELRDFIDNVNPEKLTNDLDNWSPQYETVDDYYDDDDDDDDDGGDDEAVDKRRRRRKRRQTQKSSFTVSHFVFVVRIDRAEMGHQISDMLLQCSFAGRQCLARNFTRLLTTDFGNCYTIQYDKFVSRKSGPKYGLELKLYLQTDEYVPGIATSKGIQVVVHEPDTHPFPQEEGIAIKAGSETRIGIKLVQVSRLDQPYDYCSSTEDFKKKYRIKYTRSTCQNICLYERTLKRCGCYNVLSEETRALLRRNLKNATACQSAKEIQCAERLAIKFDTDDRSCECHSPCKERLYEKTVSSREWPTQDFANLLVKTVCKNNPEDCAVLRNSTVEEVRDEFVNVVIYFEQLNFETITESPAYEIDQFLSDIGGTIGLYVGLSVLAFFEVINLITDILVYVCTGCRKK